MSVSPHSFMQEASGLLSQISLGHVVDETRRQSALALAGHHLRLAETALIGEPSEAAKAMLAELRATHARLSCPEEFSTADLQASLKDWTNPLRRPATQVAEFDLTRSLADAAREPGRAGAVFAPACAALGAGWPGAEGRDSASADLDQTLRLAALHADTFRVAAAAIAAAVVGEAEAADAILAALTTPKFRATADPGSLRLIYASLALLSHPHAPDRERAAAACDYLLGRDPGPHEIRFLAPAALQTVRKPDAVLGLYAEWVDWHYEELDRGEGAEAARNIGCSLDLASFEPLEAVLHEIGDEPSGERLVVNLGRDDNQALLLVPADSNVKGTKQCEASPKARVAAVTRSSSVNPPDKPPEPVRVRVPSLAISNELGRMQEASQSPFPAFTSQMRRRRRD